MKAFVVLCLVIAVAAQDTHLEGEQKKLAEKFSQECFKETGVNPDFVADAKKGNFNDDKNLKEYFFCFFKKFGIVDANGQIIPEEALNKLPTGIDKEAAAKLFSDCKTAAAGQNGAEATYSFFKCYILSSKQRIIF